MSIRFTGRIGAVIFVQGQFPQLGVGCLLRPYIGPKDLIQRLYDLGQQLLFRGMGGAAAQLAQGLKAVLLLGGAAGSLHLIR